MVEDALRAMVEALRAEVAAIRADRSLQGRAVTGGVRIGSTGKRTTYAFVDVPGTYPDDTPVRLVLDHGAEIDGEVASRTERELVLALHEDVGPVVEHALLIADASFLLERLADVLDDEPPLSYDLIAHVLGDTEPKVARAEVETGGLNEEQADAVALAVGSETAFVWGPPGTGKTTTVAYVVAAHAKAGRSVLLVANTNTAVDTALRRVADLLPDEVAAGQVLRYGTVVQEAVAHLAADAVSARVSAPLLAERAELARRIDSTDDESQGTLDMDHDLAEERGRVRDRLAAIDTAVEAAAAGLANDARVVATTVYQTWLGGLADRAWDVVVVDEASMLMLPMTAYAAGLASESVVVAGDFRQLPPIVSTDDRWLARDAFAASGVVEARPPWLASLRTQYRMRPEIAGLVTDLFYADNPLATGRTAWPETAPLRWLDTSELGAWAGMSGRGSRFNPVHAVLVAAYLGTLPEGSAGVVTPYAAQERLVAALLVDRFGPGARGWVSTVHRFQGNEQDAVVVDLADATGVSPGPAARARTRDDPEARLLNVAVSRARDTLLVLGDLSHTPRGGVAAHLLLLLRERGTPLALDEVLRGAFGLVRDDERVLADLATAAGDVTLFTPYVTGHGMARWSASLRALVARDVRVRVVTRPVAEQPRAAALMEQMRTAGVAVDQWAGMGERALVVDTDVTYVGGSDLGTEGRDVPMIRVKGSALPNALTDLLRPARSPRRPLGEATNPNCDRCGGPTLLRRGGGQAAYVCADRGCLAEVTDREDRPESAVGPCRQPGCAGWLVPRKGRYGTFTSCTRYPACTGRGPIGP